MFHLFAESLEKRALLSATADFNHDGFDDLAIGVPGEGGSAGAVNVIYGSPVGPTPGGKLNFSKPVNQVWTQTALGGVASVGDQFGAALAAGDFNHDGFADLAIGTPFKDQGVFNNVGGVFVIYGSATGLKAFGTQFWSQASLGIEGANEGQEKFGAALAVGDFDGDSFDDLAVGVPGEGRVSVLGPVLSNENKGAVNILYGTALGLSALENQYWDQGSPDIIGDKDFFDEFGASVAAGDFDNDGFDDLAVGVPGESGSIFGIKDHGAVNVIYGTGAGLNSAGNQQWMQGSDGIADQREFFDHFGAALAAGDFNGDGRDDLAVGIPSEDVDEVRDAGAVAVIFGLPAGLSASNNQFWHQNSTGINDSAETGDKFGSALTAGDFNGDGKDDLAIGVDAEDIGTLADGGGIQLLYGGAGAFTSLGSKFFTQNSLAILDTAEAGDRYGAAVAAGDFNGDNKADLAVGAPAEDGAGAVNVIFGNPAGLVAANNQLWSQNSASIAGVSAPGDNFGGALASGSSASVAGFSGVWQYLVRTRANPADALKTRLEGILRVTNPGNGVAAASVVRFYLSNDRTFGPKDQLLKTINLPPLGPQRTARVFFEYKLKKGQTAGGKFVIAVLDADNAVLEINEANNSVVFGPIA